MKRIGLFLLAVVMAAGLAGCNSGDDDTTIKIQVYDSIQGAGIDDSFTVAVDGNVLGQTPILEGGATFTDDFSSGKHTLRITYSGASDNDGHGSYGILLIEGATFDDGSTAKNGEIHGIGNYHEFTLVVH